MISRKVVESARFLKMPATSQNLYFPRVMRKMPCLHEHLTNTARVKFLQEFDRI